MAYKNLMNDLQSCVDDVVASYEDLEIVVLKLEKQVEDLHDQIIELQEELKAETELADLYRKIM